MGRILKGKPVTDALMEELGLRVEKLKKGGISPCLAILRVGEKGSDIAYERSAMKRAEKLGIAIKNVILPEESSQDEVLGAIERLNGDEQVHGMLVFRPMPPQIDDLAVRNTIAPHKDMDGITDGAMAGVFTDSDIGYGPCTAEAVIQTLDYYDIPVSGRNVTVIGRSLVIGRPVSMMLLHRNATVTICHSRTDDESLRRQCKEADVIVSCVGRKGFAVTGDMLSPGQTVIDVSVNVDEEGNMYGDVKFDEALEIVDGITPVPGGIGGVTSAILMKHVVEAAEKKING